MTYLKAHASPTGFWDHILVAILIFPVVIISNYHYDDSWYYSFYDYEWDVMGSH